jgi:APA family basic amino acid/polyamine antiporter
VATAAMQAIFGDAGKIIMALAIMISTFGCNNGLILAGARVYYAMACDNLFFKRVGTLNARHVPAFALITQGIWASFLTLPRTVSTDATGKVAYGNVYTQLIEYLTSADLVFYGLMVAAVIVMRKRAPQIDRPYRTFGYPLVPLVYIALAVFFVVDLGYLAWRTSGVGYLIVLSGLPAYLIWRRQAKTA